MRIPRAGERRAPPGSVVAAEDAARYAEQAPALVEQAVGVTWYEDPGNGADRAALALCRLRRARAGERGRPEAGDEAVRAALGAVSEAALVWIASRAISYMDESGYPETMERWFGDA
ncbi:MAG: hypothetical protein RMM28_02275 [Thermoleophilia bacterium]|nr:hypothetical protein [Gaiellaceae bacterium]MDW8337948.1 hypothetical protein [Thermoleophilia bacterium]